MLVQPQPTTLGRWTFYRKFVLVVTMITAVSLVLAGFALSAFDLYLQSRQLDDDTRQLVRSIQQHSRAFLADGSDDKIQTYLALLADLHAIDRVEYYDEAGRLRSQATREDSKNASQGRAKWLHQAFTRRENQRIFPMTYEGKALGTLVIEPNWGIVEERLDRFLSFVASTLLLAFFISLVFTYFFRNQLFKPIFELVKVARRVSEYNDYDVQAKKIEDDEFGILVDAFNKMIKQVKIQRQNLQHECLRVEQVARESQTYADSLKRINERLGKEISRRTEIQNELDSTKNFLQDIIDAMPSAIIGIDSERRVTHFNQGAYALTQGGRGASETQQLVDVLPMIEPYIDVITEAMEERETRHVHHFKCEMMENAYFDLTVYPLDHQDYMGAVIRLDDVTTQVKLNEVMVQTEKMMSVGGLAAGMAHEINNPLGGIMQSTQNILRRFSPELPANEKAAELCGTKMESIHEYMKARGILEFLEGIRDNGERASTIVRNMLKFSRSSDQTLFPENIHAILDRAVALAHSEKDEAGSYDFRSVEVCCNYGSDLPQVQCISAEIEQVLLNILRNAAQAMQAAGPDVSKKITLKTYLQEQEVITEISDTGPGMPESVRKKIFEPFFTTKEVGLGTGLGLSVSYFIITTNHRGRLSCTSKEGRGTTFTMALPIVAKENVPSSDN